MPLLLTLFAGGIMATVKLHLKKQFNKENPETPDKMKVGYRERGKIEHGPFFYFDQPTEVEKGMADKILKQASHIIEVWDEKKMKIELKEEQKKEFEKRIEDLSGLLENSETTVSKIEEQLKAAKESGQTLVVEQCMIRLATTKEAVKIIQDKIEDAKSKLKELDKKPDAPKKTGSKKPDTKKKPAAPKPKTGSKKPDTKKK